jgi:glycosyltransferase involved in cell wall biosynthesis
MVVMLVPGNLQARTGGYEYDRRMIAGLRARGWQVDVRELDSSFPHPTGAAREHAARVLAAIPPGTLVLVDGLALGALPREAAHEASRLRIVALVHLPLADEFGLDPDTASRLQASERVALGAARLIVVTGRSTVGALSKYGIASGRIVVVEPGTDRAPLARRSSGPVVNILSVGALTAGKGHELLFRALEALSGRNWTLVCAGSALRDWTTAERLRAQLRQSGLADRVTLKGELDAGALEACYLEADLFALATLHETYGMAVAEALAHGLPVVSTTTGAIHDLVSGDNGMAGILVPPGDVDALTNALSTLISDERARALRRARATHSRSIADVGCGCRTDGFGARGRHP